MAHEVTLEVIRCQKARKSKANEREQYKRQLRESLKDQMRESAEKRRAEFENSRNETARTIHDFRSRRYFSVIDRLLDNIIIT